MNDSSEYRHALDFAKGYAGKIHMEDDYLSGFAWVLNKALRNMQDSHIYVSSFSEVPDLLSQWRGYCPKGEGVCIGFKQEILEQFSKDNNLIIKKCLYSHQEQQNKILELMKKTLDKFPKFKLTRSQYEKSDTKTQCNYEIDSQIYFTEGEGKEEADKVLKQLCSSVEELAPYMKNQAFQEESEWRIIARNPKADIKFRPSKSHLVPYLILPILEYSSEIISEIIIGPNANEERCINSIKLLIEKNGLKSINIKKSQVPLNNW
ncbi:MAG: DUF2971 domain-containing protein [Halarcobacter sp.]